MKIAAIDIGSNSVRLGILADGKTLYKRLHTTRLGEGLTQSGVISQAAMLRTVDAISDFKKVAEEEVCDKLYAFATAAVRSAQNGQDFVALVKQRCGVVVDVIPGTEEAAIGILGALKGKDGGIIDIGGASTEVSVQAGGKRLFAQSVDIGVVRILDQAGRDVNKAEQYIDLKLSDYAPFSAKDYPMSAIGGTATTIASVKHALPVYDPNVVDGTVLTAEEVYALAQKLFSLSVEEVRAVPGMEVRRADVIAGGVLLLYKVMQRFQISSLTVSESDNLEGYVMRKEGL